MSISLVFSLVFEKMLIPILKKKKVGQNERYDGPRSHLKKAGTPTMGGIVMLITILIFTVIFAITNRSNVSVMQLILIVGLTSVGFGLIGFIDDYKKVIKHNTEGLNPKLKMIGLFIISAIFIYLVLEVLKFAPTIVIPIVHIAFELPVWLYIIFTIFVLLGTTNAVNLTDGIDGLNGSVSTIALIALGIISAKMGNIALSMILFVVAASTVGFLSYNFHPAKIFMGDTGSLFLGGILAVSSIVLQQHLLLLLICFIPVIEALSDILQLLWVKVKKKRLFKMAPIHHHLELTGWRESKVVTVFSIITFVMCTIAVLIA
jgi:phospho-N-acetylmuramoyl-pentapeptide-transferase